MPRSGEVGQQIYEQTEQLVKSGMTRTQAFAKISEDSGRQAGTVAANYYRVARKRTAGPVRRTPPKPPAAKRMRAASNGRRGSTTGSDVDRLAAELVDNVRLLATALKAQDQEIRDLRARLEGVRSALR